MSSLTSTILYAVSFAIAYIIYRYRKAIFPSLIGNPETIQRSHVIPNSKKNEGDIHRSLLSPNELVAFPEPDVQTLYDLTAWAVKKYGDKKCLGVRKFIANHEEERELIIAGKKEIKKFTKYELGSYSWMTYKDMRDRAVEIGKALIHLGIPYSTSHEKPSLVTPPKSLLCIYSNSRPEWMLMAQGCFSQGMAVMTLYANLGEEGLIYGLQEMNATHLFTTADLLPMVARISSECPTLKNVIYVEEADEAVIFKLKNLGMKLTNFNELSEIGKNSKEVEHPPVTDQLAAIVYTSGSSGRPKGVMVSHGNLLATVGAAKTCILSCAKLSPTDRYMAYLPLAHILELMLEHVMFLSGVAIGYGTTRTLTDLNMKNCRGDLAELKPTLMPGVPAVWETVRKAAIDKIRNAPLASRLLFQVGFKLKKRCIMAGIETPIMDKIFFGKFKAVVGGEMRFMLTGGAPLSKEVHWFTRICICNPTVQVYGLTETCGAGTWLPLDHVATERVGTPLPCVELKLVDIPELSYLSTNKPHAQGQVYIRGPAVSLGYFNNADQMARTYTPDGWLVTGDVGQWHPDGTLSIIDRVGNVIKLSHGEYIAIEKLESKYKTDPFVMQCMVYAQADQPKPVALIVPQRKALEDWATSNGLSIDDYTSLCAMPKVQKMIFASMLDTARKTGLKSIEMIGGVHVHPDEWKPEDGMLTAAMKLKRKDIAARFSIEIQQLYKNMK